MIVDDGYLEADAVICATTASQALKLIPDLPEATCRVLRKVFYSCGCRVVIGLDYHPLPAGWHAVLYPEDDTPLLLDRSVNLPASAPPGRSTLDILVGEARAEALLPLDDATIKREALGLRAAIRRRALRSPATTRDYLLACTAGRKPCAWPLPACLGRWRRCGVNPART